MSITHEVDEVETDIDLTIGGDAVDVSGVHSPRSLLFPVMSSGSVLVIEESADAFVADVRPVVLVNGCGTRIVPEHDWPVSRVGTAGVTMRARGVTGGSGVVTLRATKSVQAPPTSPA